MEHLCLLSLIQPDGQSKQQGGQIKGGRESWEGEGVNGKKHLGFKLRCDRGRSRDVGVVWTTRTLGDFPKRQKQKAQ